MVKSILILKNILPLSESSLYPLNFYERPTLVVFSLTERKPKRIFTFMKKDKK